MFKPKLLFHMNEHRDYPRIVLSAILLYCAQPAHAQPVTNVNIDIANGHASWSADGLQWYSAFKKDSYFGAVIPIIRVDLETGNEAQLHAINNCYYRGTLSDADWNATPQTHAFINLCHADLPFSGFVSDRNGVYSIDEDPNNPGQLQMLLDNPTAPQPAADNTANFNNGGNGGGQISKPDTQVPRQATPAKFPSVEIFLESAYVDKYGYPGYLHRVASILAFSNIIYQQSGIKQVNLVSVNTLTGNLNKNGGIGGIHHQLRNLRKRTVQAHSGDVAMLLIGDSIDSTYTWGWALAPKSACELQIAVAENNKIDTNAIGDSAAFTVDLASLIQRSWTFAHEFAHVIGASRHIKDDPLMDVWYPYLPVISGYAATCATTTQMFKSCQYDTKSGEVVDYYICG